MNFFSSKSSNCIFDSPSSVGDNQYDTTDTGAVPITKSIENSTSLFKGREVTSSKDTPGNSYTIDVEDMAFPPFESLVRRKMEDFP